MIPSSSPSDQALQAFFEQCNHTELYQICQRLHLNVHPGLSKGTLIALLLGEEEPSPEWTNAIDSWRHAIMAFLLDHWQVVRAQLACPAKTGDPLACFNCIDAQVVSCLVQNADEEHLIQLKRKG